jgi:hypothetical protein
MCDLGRRPLLETIPGTAVLGALMYGRRTAVRPHRGAAYEAITRWRHAGRLG